MEKKVWDYIGQHTMIAKRDRVLVACSGGADSIALLLLLWDRHKELGFEVEACHVEHGIRGEESLRDAAFVRELCLDRNIPYTCVRVDAPSYATSQHVGLEEAARILRYDALKKRADAIQEIEAMLDGGGNDCTSARNRQVKIALAHHMEDNAETILFQMARGSGLDGMCGMTPVRREEKYTYIRPLLGVTRTEIEAYLAGKKQAFCTDSTNENLEYSRNYVRKEILPGFENLNDQAILHMNQMAEQLTLVQDYVSTQVHELYEKLVRRDEKGLRVKAAEIASLHPMLQRELLMELMANCAGSRKDLTSAHVMSLEDLLTKQSGKRVHLPYQMQAVIRYEDLCIEKCVEADGAPVGTEEEALGLWVSEEMLQGFLQDGKPHCLQIPGSDTTITVCVREDLCYQEEIQKKAYTKTFDYDKIKSGFFARRRQEMDYLVIDKAGHTKTLSTFCIDEKIPTDEREDLLVLAKDHEIIWLLGYRMSENYKLEETTKTFVQITYGGIDNGYNKA